MPDYNHRPRRPLHPTRRFSASCLEDAGFREYYDLVRGHLVGTALEKPVPNYRCYKGIRHYFRPPPSSPAGSRSSSPVPLLELSRGPYGSNWRTLSRLPPSRPIIPEEPPSSPQQAHLETTPIPPRRELNVDPCWAVQNAETLRRRRNRTLCEWSNRFDWVTDSPKTSKLILSTHPPRTRGRLVRRGAAATPNSNTTTTEKGLSPRRHDGDSSSDEQKYSDDDDDDEEDEEEEAKYTKADWDPFWVKIYGQPSKSSPRKAKPRAKPPLLES
ncbi:hypothetical protein NPX13_g10573 [Xylaria arbuscula]|uniref:Uncharacterized protein n=1 Tax=Xylaria arbuscula TaxID=114810 RepID=A0A9W8N4B2_9PEZI|nr:hypothetical protein NPX13_g10573 [Xylaria arbuscula]